MSDADNPEREADDGSGSGAPPGAEASPQEPGGPVEAAMALVLRRPQLVFFLLGLLLFVGGMASVVSSRVNRVVDELPGNLAADGPTVEARVGPRYGDPLEPYLQRKREVLAVRAENQPDEPTLAMIIFGDYRSAEGVQQFLDSRDLHAITVHVRIPVDGFKPAEVPLEGTTLGEAASGMREEVDRELRLLQAIADRSPDGEFSEVYAADVKLHQQALAQLTDEPKTIFAVTVRSTFAELAAVTGAPNVRLVDVPDDPTATLEDTQFAAIIPEDTHTASFAIR